MAHVHVDTSNELTRLRPAGKSLGLALMIAGLVAVVLALVSSYGTETGVQRFWFAYLFGLAGITCVSGAALIFTLLNHLVRAGWITNVRRILETFALQTALVLVLALPVVLNVLARHGTIYSWAKPTDTPIVEHEEGGEAEHNDTDAASAGLAKPEGEGEHHSTPATSPAHAPTAPEGHDAQKAGVDTVAGVGSANHDSAVAQSEHNEPGVKEGSRIADDYFTNHQVIPGVKREYDENIARKAHVWLNPFFWSFRILAYFAVLAGIAYFYYSNSVRQDDTGDIDISAKLSYLAGPLTVVSGVIFSFVAFDVFMSLDPHWFSTMYGIYFFASGTQAMWALIALFVLVMQKRGYLTVSISREHRHDIGKFLWAFIFFFGYVAFSPYMLQWYANLPEETFWFDKRGYSQAHPNAYTPLVIALVAGRFVIPFLGLVSRHVKRNRFGLGFWAVWLLAFWVLDMYLLVIPESTVTRPIGFPEILAFGGIFALWLGNVIRTLANHALRPLRDPRIHESLALQNF